MVVTCALEYICYAYKQCHLSIGIPISNIKWSLDSLILSIRISLDIDIQRQCLISKGIAIAKITQCHDHLYIYNENPDTCKITTQMARFMGLTWGPAGTCRPQMHCGETVTIIAVTIIQDGGRWWWWVRAGSIVTLVRNSVLSYLYTIQGRHQSWFCVSCFVSLCICFWNMGLWNFRDMIVTYKPDIGDMIVTVHGVWS